TIQKRIKKYWNRDSEIIYPFHDLAKISQTDLSDFSTKTKKEFFILVSRLEKWKQINIAIEACNHLKEKLIIVGDGKYKEQLKKIADPGYIKFTGRISDSELIDYYSRAKALIMTQKEDF